MASLSLLFVCVGNSCRSIMAEAIARHLGGDLVVARSAGLMPAGFVAPPTLFTLEALGYPTGGLTSVGLEAVTDVTFDVVVSLLGVRGLTMLPRGIAPRREAWNIPDPFGEDDATYLRVARQLEVEVERLLADELHRELRIH